MSQRQIGRSFGAEEMRVRIGSDYADNGGKKARGINAPGRERGIIRLSAFSAMSAICRRVKRRPKKAVDLRASIRGSMAALPAGQSDSSLTHL